jgi:hypothetical protein
MIALRDTAITEYHELLVSDANLTAATFAKLREATSLNRLLYGKRPIGISLGPHLLTRQQIQRTRERVAIGRERSGENRCHTCRISRFDESKSG